MNLILVKPSEHDHSTIDGSTINLPPNDERTKHIIHHLKKSTGDEVSIGIINSNGGYKCKAIVHLLPPPQHQQQTNNDHDNGSNSNSGGGIRLVPKIDTIIQSSPKLPEITLLLAMPFPARLKYLWPVISSFVAVTRIVIVKGSLSNPEFIQSKVLQPEVYEPMIIKGMSQGCCTRPVKVDVCLDYENNDESMLQILQRLGLVCNNNNNKKSDDNTTVHKNDNTARIFLDCGDEDETPPPIRDVIIEQLSRCHGSERNDDDDDDYDDDTTTLPYPPPRAILAIGPERGWTEDEAKMFVNDCGFKSATLGSSILRVDTAVVSSLGIVSSVLDEVCSMIKQNESSDRDCKKRRKGQDSSSFID